MSKRSCYLKSGVSQSGGNGRVVVGVAVFVVVLNGQKYSISGRYSQILFAQVEYQKEYEMYLRDQFIAADKSKNGFLCLNEFAALLKQLNINMEEEEIEKVFEEANTDKGTMVGVRNIKSHKILESGGRSPRS